MSAPMGTPDSIGAVVNCPQCRRIMWANGTCSNCSPEKAQYKETCDGTVRIDTGHVLKPHTSMN